MSISFPIFPISVYDPVPMLGQSFVMTLQQEQMENYFLPRVESPYEGYFVAIFTCAVEGTDLFKEEVIDLSPLYSNGVLCKIETIDEFTSESGSSYSAITLTIGDHSVPVSTLEMKPSRTIYCTLTSSELNPTISYPPHIAEDANTIFAVLCSRDAFFDGAPRSLQKTITSETATLFQKCNALANFVLTTSSQRVDYLQATTPAQKYIVLLKGLNAYLASRQKISRSDVWEHLSEKSEEKSAVVPKNIKRKPLIKKRFSKKKAKDDWRAKLEESPMPDAIKEKLEREIVKVENTPKGSTEYAQATDYLRWVFDIPWESHEFSETDLKQLHANLDEEHYGLNEVKEHIVEVMCVQQLQAENTGSVLCFIGPAGTGKTTIAKSIAANSNRPVIHIALGGLSDVAELRGFRRTYIASRPGRLISEVINKKTLAPLIILDEIDKMQAVKGDPAAALLEILDPEQNHEFTDHYLELPIDLSKAMFVCTANYEEQIPAPLKDRMELIRFRSYKHSERDVITRKFVLPKVMKKCNPTNLPVTFEEDAIEQIVHTKQVRQIEKMIAKLTRKGVTQVHVYDADEYSVTKEQVLEIQDNYKEKKPHKSVGF